MFGQKNETQPDLEIFAMWDSKAQCYKPPVLSTNKHTALRELSKLMSENKSHEFFSNAEDFQLFKIGDYSYRTAKINWHNPEAITGLHELKAALQSSN